MCFGAASNLIFYRKIVPLFSLNGARAEGAIPMSFLHRARFFTTASSLDNLIFPSVAEVAFAGRSNAGKSSAINTLANQKRMAFTSKTPGRTQQLNYFALGADPLAEPDRYLVDLPGYGYAKVTKTERVRWNLFLSNYLASREQLAGLVLIMDARHPLTDLDLEMLEWFAVTEKPVHVLLTKADKLSRNEQAATLASVRRTMNLRIGTNSVSLFSSLKKTGCDEVEAVLSRWLDIPLETPKAKPQTAPKPTATAAKTPHYRRHRAPQKTRP